MNEADLIITEYLQNSYIIVASEQRDKCNLTLVKSKIDGLLYACKYYEQFNISIYRKLKELSPKGIPKIYEIIETAQGLIIIEEYIEGQTVEEYIDSLLYQYGKNNEMYEETICNICSDVCDILNAIHSTDPPVIHRDIKPQNILIDNSNVYLVDYNIAREYTGKRTKDTFIMGTVDYAAPEQYGFAESDIRTDIYGLGATVRYMVDTLGVTSPKLDTIIKRATAIDPKNRFQSANELKKAFRSKNGKSDNILKRYLIPGYRSGNILHMIIATIVYFIFFTVIIQFQIGGNPFTGVDAYIYNLLAKIYLSICFLMVVFLDFDYLGFRSRYYKFMHVKDKHIILRILALIMADILIWVFFFCIYVCIVYILYGERLA